MHARGTIAVMKEYMAKVGYDAQKSGGQICS